MIQVDDSHVPEYNLQDTDQELIISIVAPLSKPKEAVILLEKEVFTFDSPPYLLILNLPHPVSNDFSQPAYNSETKTYLVRLRKNFNYQVQTNENTNEFVDPAENLNGGNGELPSRTKEKQYYGFANKYSNMFGKLYDEFSEVINLPDPDHTDVKERRKFRLQEENEKWSDDHYLADTMEIDHMESIFQYKPPWITSPLKGDYTSDEREMLDEFVNKPKLKDLSAENKQLSEYQLVDVLFCYAYNKRTTEGDNTVESGWTINKLSSTLSWLEVFEDLKSVLLSCYRRALIYPLYRNWNLVQLVKKDVGHILKLGPKQVTRSLLEVREIFDENDNDNRYILNILYVNELCAFAYHMSPERCTELSTEVNETRITKYEVNNDLPLLEVAAHLALEEETQPDQQTDSKVDSVIQKMASINFTSNSSSQSSSEGFESSESSDNERP